MADTILSTPADYGEFLRAKIKMAKFVDQVHYLKAAEREHSMPDLFDVLEVV